MFEELTKQLKEKEKQVEKLEQKIENINSRHTNEKEELKNVIFKQEQKI